MSGPSLRERVDQVLSEVEQLDARWSALCAVPNYVPPAKAWEADDDERRRLSHDLAEVLQAVRRAADEGRARDLEAPVPEVLVMTTDEGDLAIVCPRCEAMVTTLWSVERGERWCEGEVQMQPDRVPDYAIISGRGLVLVGEKPNPAAGLPLLRVFAAKDEHVERDRLLCTACEGRVRVPEWMDEVDDLFG